MDIQVRVNLFPSPPGTGGSEDQEIVMVSRISGDLCAFHRQSPLWVGQAMPISFSLDICIFLTTLCLQLTLHSLHSTSPGTCSELGLLSCVIHSMLNDLWPLANSSNWIFWIACICISRTFWHIPGHCCHDLLMFKQPGRSWVKTKIPSIKMSTFSRSIHLKLNKLMIFFFHIHESELSVFGFLSNF